jgi:hypothetical protein
VWQAGAGAGHVGLCEQGMFFFFFFGQPVLLSGGLIQMLV